MKSLVRSPSALPSARQLQTFPFPAGHRTRGLHILAGSGSGKSLAIGHLAFGDFLRGTSQCVFDPAGQAIDAFLMRVSLLPAKYRRRAWSRVRYVDVSGRLGSPPPWPLLFRLPGETLHEVASRFLDTVLAIDPALLGAPLMGANALRRIGLPVGIILASLGLQLDQAASLLDDPRAWGDRLDAAAATCPEAAQAAAFFRQHYMGATPRDRLAMTTSYRAKLELVTQSPQLHALCCRAPAGIDFPTVMARRETVLLDFRGVTSPTARLFATRWLFDCIMSFVRWRGPGLHAPLSIHFDEIVELAAPSSTGTELFAQELEQLFNVIQRNYSLQITAAHQSQTQLTPRIQETLLTLGTQMLGVVADLESAETLARRFGPLDVHRSKRFENVWASDSIDDGFMRSSTHFVIDQRQVDLTLDEQAYLLARRLMALPPFTFLIKGLQAQSLTAVSLRRFLEGIWPTAHGPFLTELRRSMTAREARRLGADVLPTEPLAPDTMGDDHAHHDDHHTGYTAHGAGDSEEEWDTWAAPLSAPGA